MWTSLPDPVLVISVVLCCLVLGVRALLILITSIAVMLIVVSVSLVTCSRDTLLVCTVASLVSVVRLLRLIRALTIVVNGKNLQVCCGRSNVTNVIVALRVQLFLLNLLILCVSVSTVLTVISSISAIFSVVSMRCVTRWLIRPTEGYATAVLLVVCAGWCL